MDPRLLKPVGINNQDFEAFYSCPATLAAKSLQLALPAARWELGGSPVLQFVIKSIALSRYRGRQLCHICKMSSSLCVFYSEAVIVSKVNSLLSIPASPAEPTKLRPGECWNLFFFCPALTTFSSKPSHLFDLSMRDKIHTSLMARGV